MTEPRHKKLKWLEHNLPEGLVADASWLTRHGYSTALRSQYVAARWLEQPARGVYRRPGGPLTWEQVVISLQMLLKRPLTVGGRTALELQGYGHYLRQGARAVHLYGPKRPPGWLEELRLGASFVYHNNRRLFRDEPAPRGCRSQCGFRGVRKRPAGRPAPWTCCAALGTLGLAIDTLFTGTGDT